MLSVSVAFQQSFRTLEFFILVRQGGRERYEADGKVSINYYKKWGALGANKLIILMICFENNFTGSLVEWNNFREIKYRMSEIFIIIQQSMFD